MFSKQSFLCRTFIGIFLAFGLIIGWHSSAIALPDAEELARAVREIEYIDAMRSSLASSLKGRTEPPDKQTFAQVCKPVGMRTMQLGKENGWVVKQIAAKYRNPMHAPDTQASKAALAAFAENPDLKGFWHEETLDGQEGIRYYRRIDIEASCLECHGLKSDRPNFVKENYPQDLAYDFEVGDLRGMYAAFIPDVKTALLSALDRH